MRHKTTGSSCRSKIEKRPSTKSQPQEPTLTTNHRYTYLTVSPETQDDHRFQPRFFRRRSSKPQRHKYIRGNQRKKKEQRRKTREKRRKCPPTGERAAAP
ncbi:hypothetical protein F2Q69_00060429 [Brassica cretica]|uniref:Uncharacterized protein n=1 Tax=Brassica cretica TaxID=69181 RepID=A0A8S9RI08_BRACR|nr:hypothetical protein F2Q69_00060429 [Brassica cretica]